MFVQLGVEYFCLWSTLFFSLPSSMVSIQISAPNIQTKYGIVSGIARTYHNETVFQYRKIPYADPPIGNLRFAKPRPHREWSGILNGTRLGPSCMQFMFDNDKWLLENTDMSEDCLHLNVYIPRAIDKLKPKAVMVWIHGGGFTAGQGTLFDASYIALQGDVIVVTLNYRLGLLGFLSTEDSSAPGNYGLWDQKLAIEWTKENIEHFGGDTENICIFGESAGAYSVGLHSMIPLNKGLFKRAILESGATYSPRALATGARKVAEHAGNLLNCSTDSTASLINCLRAKLAEDILNSQNAAITNTFPVSTLSFINRCGPVVDGELIIGDPVQLLQDKSSESFQFFSTLDMMAGTNSAEGGLLYFSLKNLQNEFNFNISEGIPARILCEIIGPTVTREYFDNDDNLSRKFCERYTVPNGALEEQGRATLDVYADLQFLVPTVRTLLAHDVKTLNPSSTSSTGHSYQYVFSHEPTFRWIQEHPHWFQGANHAGELPFVFGLEAMYPRNKSRPEAEMELSHQMMLYWSNFAKTGNPNLPRIPLFTWPEFSTNQRQFMNLTTPSPYAGQRYHDDHVSFWLAEYHNFKGSNNKASIKSCFYFGTLLWMILSIL